jgi:hypothetical protein
MDSRSNLNGGTAGGNALRREGREGRTKDCRKERDYNV